VATLQQQQPVRETLPKMGGAWKPSAPLRPHVIGAVFGRNFQGYFSNPAGYVFITLFVLVSSLVAFCLPVFFANNLANLDSLNLYMPYLLLFFIPAITMSIWAEERRQGTDELLLTLPARDIEVVLGKYFAALGIFTVALLFSLSHVLVLWSLGSPDPGVMLSTYLGYWLMGAMLIAVGMVASMLSNNVTVAFILGALLCSVPVFIRLIGFVGAPATALIARGGSVSAGSVVPRFLDSLSVPSQFRDFGQGVVPLSGVLYFVSLAAAMLYLNIVLLGRRHWAGGERSRRLWAHATTRVIALVVALIGLDAMVARAGWRMDWSAEGLNTLSSESKKLIRELPSDRPVYIQAFISPEVPREYIEARTDLVNLLKEYAAIGGNRIRLNVVETSPFSEVARDAEKRFGITARRVQTVDQGKMSSEEIYLGVAFTSGTEEVVVPFFDRGLPVEYELTRSIRVVSRSSRKKIGILQTDAKLLGGFNFSSGNMGQDEEWQIVTELKKQYEVTTVSADTEIDTKFDALLVAQPSSLTQKGIDNLTTYVRNGGATLLLCDPLPMIDPKISPDEPRMPPGGMFGGGPPPEPKGNLRPLLDMLGVEVATNEVVWNRYNPHPQLEMEPEIVFVGRGSGLKDEAFSTDPATASLEEVVAIFSGSVRKKAGSPITFIPLLTTDRSGGTIPWSELVQRSFMGLRPNPNAIPLPSNESYVLAARLKGSLGSEPASAETKKEDPAKKSESKGGRANVVVLADLDMVSDIFFDLRRKSSENLDIFNFDNVTFVINCVDELVGDDAFIALRSRRPKHRTLTAVEEQSKEYVKKATEDSKKAEDQAKAELAKAQGNFDEKVRQVDASQDKDEQTKRIELETIRAVENRKLDVTKSRIEDEKRKAILSSRAEKERAIQAIQARIKTLAVILPPLPALLLGGLVFFVRSGKENRGTLPSRLA
jgi:ABC-2 type transport system permease protein